MEKEGLGAASLLAVQHRLDGSVLYALYFETKKEAVNSTFKADCADIGLTDGTTLLKLKGKLAILFG